MDLGIAGRRAIVCGSSRGLGRACAAALAAEGVHVVINGRGAEQVARTVDELSSSTVGSVTGVVADVTTEQGRAELLQACPEPDILVNNSAGPNPGTLEELDPVLWMEAIERTMLSPLALIRSAVDGMRLRRFGRIVNITSAMVCTPRPHMALSGGARAGLTAVVKGLSREVAPYNVTINNLLPERIDTGRQEFMARRAVETDGVTYEQARERMAASIAAKRLGHPDEFGATCAFVCSAHAGYMSGMNIRLDGGSYPGLI